MTKRIKRAARRERALRYSVMYVISAALLVILLAPAWLWLFFWRD